MHAILGDAEVMRFWSSLPHAALADSAEWVALTIAAVEAGTCDDFAVCLDGRLVGKAGLWRDNEIGMIFARAVWGRGIAREATVAILGRADRRGLASVVADIDPRNGRVLRLLTALGFVESGFESRTFCLGGVWSDSLYLTRSRPEAPSGSAPPLTHTV